MFSWFFNIQSHIIPTSLQRLQHLSGLYISFHSISLCSSVLDLGSLVKHLHFQQACLLPSCIPQSPFVCRGRWWRAFAQASFSGLSCPGCHGNQQAHLTLEITFTIYNSYNVNEAGEPQISRCSPKLKQESMHPMLLFYSFLLKQIHLFLSSRFYI